MIGVMNVVTASSFVYQLDFRIPGSKPLFAISLKQMRHSFTLPMKNRERPHATHRFTVRVENFGFFSDRAIADFFAIIIMLRSLPSPTVLP